MTGIAVLATPLIQILYGPRWLDAAPLLKWIALSQLCYVAVPLAYGDLPLLLDRKTGLIRRNLLETGPLGAADRAGRSLRAANGWLISRFIHGLICHRDLRAIHPRRCSTSPGAICMRVWSQESCRQRLPP